MYDKTEFFIGEFVDFDVDVDVDVDIFAVPMAVDISGTELHECGLDINVATCCSNTEYCIISPSIGPSCCAIGSNCDSPCSSASYLSNKTITISSTTTVTTTCLPRACPSISNYQCASSLGGGCCNYNAQCISSAGSSGCAVTISSSSTPALVSIIPSGCTTNQFACASSMGGGCCDNGFGCTVLSGTNYCAATTGTGSAIRTGSNGILATGSSDANSTSNNRGLSTGAKAGIGVAVALLVLACVGACIYFFTIHRRRALHSNSSSHRDADNPPAAMSQLSGSRISHKSESKAGSKISRPGVSPRGRQGSDYFGMTTAPSGPFTESAGTSPGLASRGGVPATPQSPSDIAAPVEIGGEGMETRREEGNASVATTPGGGWEYVKREKFRERIAELE
ncbi:similar to transcription factor Zn, C2H2 [Botrytis cinerea T4]|uniref:Similar to transcription factor Zn, C2H2 n=1 Tax=Botryotinia fuckeliana (strain T4) TaxID=999810 RepID=G2XQW6_BOTF4|nr:similar to transcription factor Zn, C2H2 [Botrytis cinerea T4]